LSKIVNLQSYRTKTVEQRGFGPWYKRFGETYNKDTLLSDLSAKTLYFLAIPGEKYAVAYYELIMGILGLGKGLKFYYLDKKEQVMIMDIHLFLADQIRFEMMRRLGWLNSFPCDNFTLLKMVQDFNKVKDLSKEDHPELAKSHPGYAAYSKLTRMDKNVFIRKMFRDALEVFREQLE
jgi:hypothetical protein